MPENRALVAAITKYPGLFFIDAHQQSSGYFFPPDQDAALNEISHSALDAIQNVIGPAIQNAFNDQTGQYRNYNTYDLFVPEYGDTVPSLLQGGAGMTYEKGNNENYGKQVYDHYLAIDTTVNVVADNKASLLTDWVKQWPEAVSQGKDCIVQDNTQVSPPVVDQYEIGQSTIDQEPNVTVCGYYYLPGDHSGDVAQTIKDLQYVGVQVYRLDRAVTVTGAHAFGDFNVNAVQGQDPVRTQTLTLPAGTLYIPLAQGTKHWIQAVLDENPYLPFNYFYDEVTWSYSLLRGFAGDGFLTQQLPAGSQDEPDRRPGSGQCPGHGSAGVRVQHRLRGRPGHGQPAPRPGRRRGPGGGGFDASGVHFDSGAALVVRVVDPAGHACRRRRRLADAGVRPGRLPGQPLRGDPAEDRDLHRRDHRADQPGLPRQRGRLLHDVHLLRGHVRPDPEGADPGLPDQPAHLDRSGQRRAAKRRVHGPDRSGLHHLGDHADRHGGHARAGRSGVRQRRRHVPGHRRRRRDQRPQRRPDHAEHQHGQRHQHAGLDVRRDVEHRDPAGWGFDAGGWIYRESSNDPNFDPATLARRRRRHPPATAVATLRPGRRLRWPGRVRQLLRLRGQRQRQPARRPAVVDQPFGAGHAIMLGFDPWYRAWTTQEERLVLNAILYPAGTAIPAGQCSAR